MRINFKSFQSRLIFFLISLLVIVLTSTLVAVNKVSIDNTKKEINHALQVSSEVFANQLDDNVQKLLEIARLLSSDYAFKSAYSTHDHDTILSAMRNHLSRIAGENIMLLVSLEHQVIANTHGSELDNKIIPWLSLQQQAEKDDYGEATSIVLVNNQPYQLMIVPLLIPDIDAWIHIGFPINSEFATRIAAITQTDISIFHQTSNMKWQGDASTLVEQQKKSLTYFLNNHAWQHRVHTLVNHAQDDHISLIIPLSDPAQPEPVVTVISRSLDRALLPYKRLRLILFILFTISMVVSIILAWLLARKVTHPVKMLTKGARAIQEGDYSHTLDIKQHDEIGVLANSFNSMAKGLAEKEKVRNLLGKVVSPAIAEELMSKDVELGGEERFVTTLFSDVRNFTSLCEGRAPSEILALLNEYFTAVTTAIEKNGGVVDKYIGDAVMALFGAPLQHPDDANHAITSARDMCHALEKLNTNFKQRNIAPLEIGIGINSDMVVAGNMGSTSRMNYTVIGDGVNLASRLEGLTKNYGVELIVSESTKNIADAFFYQQLDRVRVKGKNDACIIYQPLGLINEIADEIKNDVNLYHDALSLYRNMQWHNALTIFNELAKKQPATVLYQIYIKRCHDYIKTPPADDWDGCYTFTTK